MQADIRQASRHDDPVLVQHYLALWESYGTPLENFEEDAAGRVLAFIEDGYRSHELGVFLAFIEGRPVGSAACQIIHSPYPNVIKPEFRRFGYVWSVFVQAEHRGKGVAHALMLRTLDHLKRIGCTTAVLHSSDAGAPLYVKLGFEFAKEMRLPLRD